MSGKNHPFADVCESAEQRIREGHTVFQKFTCGNCGVRQTIDVPNTFYLYGRCEECNHVTDLRESGCNYLLMTGLAEEYLSSILNEKG